ncbi:S1 family peptidase [Delftia acidovorans]|uniref:S1 family peptidase n=1 Tax=Delftia acidovorans TaxID=80866 RepID=UPI0033404A00
MHNILFTIGVLAATGSFAQESSTDYQQHTTKDSALKAAGLEAYATPSNDKIIQESSKSLDEIKKELGDNFGGAWIEYDENNQAMLVIGATNAGTIIQSQKQKNTPNERVIFKQVEYKLSYLRTVEEKISETFRGVNQGNEPILLSIGVDEKNNKILARGRKENLQYITEILQRAGFDLRVIELEEQNGPVTLMGTIFGGTKIGSTHDGTPSMYLCTTGFNVVIDNIYPGSITAAHCYNYDKARKFVHFNLGSSPTGSIKGPQIGEYFADGWPDAMDAAIFGNTNFVHTLQRQVITTGNNVANVRPLATALPSAVVCTSGGSNGWRCGSLTSINMRHQIGGRDFFLNEFSACGGPGDSGGPVLSNTFNALGIYVGSVGNNPNGTCGAVMGGSAPAKSVYQPLGPYLAKYNNVQIMAN